LLMLVIRILVAPVAIRILGTFHKLFPAPLLMKQKVLVLSVPQTVAILPSSKRGKSGFLLSVPRILTPTGIRLVKPRTVYKLLLGRLRTNTGKTHQVTAPLPKSPPRASGICLCSFGSSRKPLSGTLAMTN
jgi:hypothetical protein